MRKQLRKNSIIDKVKIRNLCTKALKEQYSKNDKSTAIDVSKKFYIKDYNVGKIDSATAKVCYRVIDSKGEFIQILYLTKNSKNIWVISRIENDI